MYLSRLGIESSRGCRRIMMMSMPDGVPSVLLPNLGAFGSTVWADWYFYHHTHTLHQATFTLCFLQIHFYSASCSPALWNPVHPHTTCIAQVLTIVVFLIISFNLLWTEVKTVRCEVPRDTSIPGALPPFFPETRPVLIYVGLEPI